MQEVETARLTAFETASGAVYEIDHEHSVIRRLSDATGTKKRGDDLWLPYVALLPKEPTVGVNQTIVLHSLADLGPDDVGTPEKDASRYTTRTTTAVTDTWTIKP